MAKSKRESWNLTLQIITDVFGRKPKWRTVEWGYISQVDWTEHWHGGTQGGSFVFVPVDRNKNVLEDAIFLTAQSGPLTWAGTINTFGFAPTMPFRILWGRNTAEGADESGVVNVLTEGVLGEMDVSDSALALKVKFNGLAKLLKEWKFTKEFLADHTYEKFCRPATGKQGTAREISLAFGTRKADDPATQEAYLANLFRLLTYTESTWIKADNLLAIFYFLTSKLASRMQELSGATVEFRAKKAFDLVNIFVTQELTDKTYFDAIKNSEMRTNPQRAWMVGWSFDAYSAPKAGLDPAIVVFPRTKISSENIAPKIWDITDRDIRYAFSVNTEDMYSHIAPRKNSADSYITDPWNRFLLGNKILELPEKLSVDEGQMGEILNNIEAAGVFHPSCHLNVKAGFEMTTAGFTHVRPGDGISLQFQRIATSGTVPHYTLPVTEVKHSLKAGLLVSEINLTYAHSSVKDATALISRTFTDIRNQIATTPTGGVNEILIAGSDEDPTTYIALQQQSNSAVTISTAGIVWLANSEGGSMLFGDEIEIIGFDAASAEIARQMPSGEIRLNYNNELLWVGNLEKTQIVTAGETYSVALATVLYEDDGVEKTHIIRGLFRQTVVPFLSAEATDRRGRPKKIRSESVFVTRAALETSDESIFAGIIV